MITFLTIALPLPVHKLFTYKYEHTDKDSKNFIGCRALLPFGKRIMTGIIVKSDVNIPEIKGIKSIIEILDDMPIFSDSMLELTKRMSDYYFCSWGETLKAALPQGMTPKSVMSISLLYTPTSSELEEMEKKAPKRAALLHTLISHQGPLTVVYLERILKTGSVADQLDALERSHIIVCEHSIQKSHKARTQKAISLEESLLHDHNKLREALDVLDTKHPKQSALLSHIYIQTSHSTHPLLLHKVLEETSLSQSIVQSLLKKKFITIKDIEAPLVFDEQQSYSLASRDESKLGLTVEQQHAHVHIVQALKDAEHKTFLLHGITGSGKTLVYIQAIKSAIAYGKNCLLLLPEIALTPQLTDRFKAVFGGEIAILHSKMSAAERYGHWRRIQNGKAKIVIGARSALFAPFPSRSLGLIIVDEEHEPSYKQESPAPRYNARDSAVMRAAIEKAVIVLGSATPSMESMFNAQQGKYHYLQIQSRADGAHMPTIHCIDIKQQRKQRAMMGNFSMELLTAIMQRLAQKQGVILFHNRRGFARFQECIDCGAIPMCKHCSISLTLHKSANMLKCHYCGYAQPALKICSICGGTDIKETGSGTQKIEEELQETLLQMGYTACIQRMDLDTTTQKGSHRKILEDFHRGIIDILIGTQMVAKGLDFARVTLVGIIDADQQLFMPDFRASERTFQLITQVAGRAGRSGEYPGEVLLQTAQPYHQTIIAALTNNYETFYSDELQIRKDTFFPPFSRLIRIEFSGIDEQRVHESSQHFNAVLPSLPEIYEKLGPITPLIARLRSHYRKIILLKSNKLADPSGERVRHAIRFAYHHYQEKYANPNIKLIIDIDTFDAV